MPVTADRGLRPDATDELTALLRERILVLDGAMGTMIQRDRPVRGRTTAASGSRTGPATSRATTTCSA